MRPTLLKPGITLYLIRHGETDWNRDARYQGQRDVPLNATGRAQAQRQGEVLKPLMPALADFDFVSSPLGRAVETMKLIRAALGLDAENFRTDPQIVELSYGHWEGRLAAELPKTDPAGLAQKASDPFGWRPSARRELSRFAAARLGVAHDAREGHRRRDARRRQPRGARGDFWHRGCPGAVPGRAAGQDPEASRRDDVVALRVGAALLLADAASDQRIKRAGEAAPRLFVTHWVHDERPFDRGRSNPGGTVFWLVDGFLPSAVARTWKQHGPQSLRLSTNSALVPVHAILRCDAGCVRAAIACSAELPVKYGYRLRVLSSYLSRKRDGTIDVRRLWLS